MDLQFFADAAGMLRGALVEAGYQVGIIDSDEQVRRKYFSARHRRIELRPRKFLIPPGFVCPPLLKPGLALLREKVESGGDLRRNQSKRISNPEYDDLLLDDWGIDHFHLGESIEPNGFVSRTNPVLFARVTPENFYALVVLPHGSWSKKALIETIHSNWPDSIKQFRIRGVKPEFEVTEKEIQDLRDGSIMTITTVSDGTIYIPVGGGIVSDGTSLRAGLMADDFCRNVALVEDWTKNNLNQMLELARQAGADVKSPIEVRLGLVDGRVHVIENNSRAVFPVPVLDPIPLV